MKKKTPKRRPSSQKVLTSIEIPEALQPEVESYLVNMRRMYEILGDGSWATVLKIVDAEWAAKALGKDPKQQESNAKVLVGRMAMDHIIEMGGKPNYRTVQPKGKRNVKRPKRP